MQPMKLFRSNRKTASAPMPKTSSWICMLLLLLISIQLVVAGNTHRHHAQQQQKKRVVPEDDYEYRDVSDYTSGVFVDSVPIASTKKSAPSGSGMATTQSEFQNTNRYPKLRKFYDSGDEERRWYESIFAQRK